MIADLCKYPMFVGSPIGKTRQLVEDDLAVGVEDMRSVSMNQDAVFIVEIIGIPGDMRSSVAKKHALIAIGCKSLCQDRTGKPCTHNQIIVNQRRRGA